MVERFGREKRDHRGITIGDHNHISSGSDIATVLDLIRVAVVLVEFVEKRHLFIFPIDLFKVLT